MSLRFTEILPVRGKLFYRASGVDYFQVLPLHIESDHTELTLPASAVVSPGIEYYIQVTDASGKTATSPKDDARRSPHTLPVLDAASSPKLRLISPDTTRPFQEEILSIVIEVDPPEKGTSYKSHTLLLDETDITDLAAFSGEKLAFSSPLIPEAGQHTLYAEVEDDSGKTHARSWTFEVASNEKDAKDKKKREVYARGGLSFNYGRQIKSPSGQSGDSLSGNLNLDFGIKGPDWEATWNGINVQYVKDSPGREFTISHGFHFTLKKGQQLLEFGDISIRESALTAPSFARRGIQAKLKGYETEVHLFNVSTTPVSGWDSGLSRGNRQVYGLSVSRSLLSGNRLPINLTFIQGENSAANNFNSAGTQSASKGDVIGLTLSHSIRQVNLSGEFASSRFDANTTDTKAEKSGIAGTTNLSTNLGRYAVGLGYHYYGTDFASIANPNFSTDRQGVSGNVSAPFGPSNLSLSLGRTSDNVGGDATRPVVSSTSASLSYSLSVEPWPSLNASYSKSLQESDKEPPGSPPIKSSNDAISLSLSKSGEKWNATLGSNYSTFEDKIGNLGSNTRGVNLSGSYAATEDIRLSPSFSHTQSESGDVVKTTSIASISTGMPIYAPYADTSLQFSYTLNDASDGSIDSSNQNGSWRLSLNLDEFFTKTWTEFGRKSLALSSSYSRIQDKISPANSREDISVFLSINFFAPIEWAWGF